MSRQDLRRFAALAERLVAALELLATPELDVAALAVPVAPEPMLVRHLGVQHLGRWILLPGRPESKGRPGITEPSLSAAAGRLVGIQPGRTEGEYSFRVLVLLQGSRPVELSVRVDDRVDVAPREWN